MPEGERAAQAKRAPRGALLTFWGVRRGIAAPGAATAGFGGNSPCAAIEFLDDREDDRGGDESAGRGARAMRHVAILDAGTGLRPLGARLAGGGPVACDLLFSRTGFDRICGLPFFAAAFDAANRIAFHSPRRDGADDIRAVLTRLMADPVFPVPIAIFQAATRFHDLAPGEKAALFAGMTAAALPLANAGTAWRLELAGAALVYACAPGPQDTARLAAFARGCDVLVLGPAAGERGDAAATAIARRAEATVTVVTDHAPEASDDRLRRRDEALQRRLPSARLAREGMAIPLPAR